MVVIGASRYALLPAARATPRAVRFEDVVGAYQDEVFGVALRLLGDRDLADDVTARVFLKAYRGFDRYDPARPLRNWLLTIAVREATSAARSTGRERSRRAPSDAAAAAPAPEREQPELRALEREERDRIRRAVTELPELYRVPVVLRYFNDLDLAEIAAVTGRRADTVAVQLHRARALLRARLEGGPR